MKLRRRYYVLWFIFVILTLFWYILIDISRDKMGLIIDQKSSELNREYKGISKIFLLNNSNCRIPYINPFDEEAAHFFRKVPYLLCAKLPPLTYIVKNGPDITLHINQSLLTEYSLFTINCCYSNVYRIPYDANVWYSSCVSFSKTASIESPTIRVTCRNPIGYRVYSNVHYIIHEKFIPRGRAVSKRENSTSVLFVGIDSISKINLERTMPQTWNFLLRNRFSTLNGYTKIEDNTFPNLAAILTGKTYQQIYAYCDPEHHEFNGCDVIWDRFRTQGYITAYAEDLVQFNTFNYYRLGFSEPPTDIYLRPYFIASEDLPYTYKKFSHYCSGPENSGERIMNAAKDFMTTFKDYPKFGLFFMVTFSHSDISLASSMDKKVAEFLGEIYNNLDQNTILILFSDHGFRYGNFRFTNAGWLEERLPFIFVHFPEKFKRDHPLKYRNFQINTQRLTNPFDIYMTLQDILHLDNTSYQIKPSEACPKCHTLFQEVDENRTCKDAAIEDHWCLCSALTEANSKSKIVQDAAKFIIYKVNQLIKSDTNTVENCALFELQKIMSSKMSNSYFNEKNQSVYHLLLLLETSPFATFEATVQVIIEDDYNLHFRLLGDISRTNSYASVTKCVKNSKLEKYCYCEAVVYRFFESAVCTLFNC